MKKLTIIQIQQLVRDLRDADSHVCPMAEHQDDENPGEDDDYPCTCGGYDEVIDALDAHKEEVK